VPRGALPAPQVRRTTAKPRAAAGEVRLIGGQWKRSKLSVPDTPGLRPTPDRVRETLFNWLGQDLGGWRCLDVFAGSGALGFEAASRGASSVLLVERDTRLVQVLHAARERLGAQAVLSVQAGDGLRALRAASGSALDLVFLDPPYADGLLPQALDAAAEAVRPGGWVYAEHRAELTHWPSTLQPWRMLKAGAVHAYLFRRDP
jgi:16S rRNA (guanine966-N2)-methyltransferase